MKTQNTSEQCSLTDIILSSVRGEVEYRARAASRTIDGGWDTKLVLRSGHRYCNGEPVRAIMYLYALRSPVDTMTYTIHIPFAVQRTAKACKADETLVKYLTTRENIDNFSELAALDGADIIARGRQNDKREDELGETDRFYGDNIVLGKRMHLEADEGLQKIVWDMNGFFTALKRIESAILTHKSRQHHGAVHAAKRKEKLRP